MNTSQKLRRDMDRGMQIVYLYPPYEGWEVIYSPRSRTDAKPWLIVGEIRAFGHECKSQNHNNA